MFAGFSSINLLNRLDGITNGGYVENYDDLHLEMNELNKEYYIFNEPHPTGGDAAVRISRENAIKWMRNSKNKKFLAVIDSLSEEEIIDEFCTIHYAWKEG